MFHLRCRQYDLHFLICILSQLGFKNASASKSEGSSWNFLWHWMTHFTSKKIEGKETSQTHSRILTFIFSLKEVIISLFTVSGCNCQLCLIYHWDKTENQRGIREWFLGTYKHEYITGVLFALRVFCREWNKLWADFSYLKLFFFLWRIAA